MIMSFDIKFIRREQARGYEFFFILNIVEHEILNALKDKNIKKFGFLGSDKHGMLFFMFMNVKCQQLLAF